MDIVSRTPFTLKLIQRFPGYKESVGSKFSMNERDIWENGFYTLASPILQLPSFLPITGLSPALLRGTWEAACARFTPNNSGQRLPPTYYRGCWHVVSRGLLFRYRQCSLFFALCLFVPDHRVLQPEGRHHSRGVAPSGFRPLRKIPHCCLP